MSRRRRLLWIHEDSGNPERIYGITPTGRTRTTVDVRGATNRDWEDIALAGRTIWLGDIGDNGRSRSGIQVYWFREPGPSASGVTAKVLYLRYEDGRHDAEALFVDRRHDTLYIVTKELFRGYGDVYRVNISDIRDGASRTLRRVGRVPIGSVTAADLGPQGIIVKSYTKALLYPWTSDHRVGSTLSREGCPVTVGGGESIALRPSNGRLYAIPEGTSPPIRYSAPT